MKSFIGGKDKNKHWDGRKRLPREHRLSTKTPVIGAVSRKGNVVARVLEFVTKEAALSFVREMVSDKVSLLATDENRVYRGLTEIQSPDGRSFPQAVRRRCRSYQHD